MDYGFISILIPLIVILFAVFTKRIIPSLVIGILAGGILLARGNVIKGVIYASDHIVKSAATQESMYIIMFLFVFGAFGEIMKMAGGIKGFTKLTGRFVKTEKSALWAVWLVTPVTFIDCCFHGISAGTVGKALIDKVQGDKRKFAHVLNVTSCLLIILIPFGTTYIGYIVGVISQEFAKAGLDRSAYEMFLESIPFNFYAIIMILISIGVIVFNGKFYRKLDSKVGREQMEDSEHDEHEGHEQCAFEEKAPARSLNLILPLAFLIVTTFFFFWYTGRDKADTFLGAILNAEFEKSIFMSGLISIVVTSIYYVIQKVPLKEIESHFLIGGNDLVPPIIILILSWGLSGIVEDLGFVNYITTVLGPRLPAFLIPAAIFLIGCIVSYFMGSAWGTWALIMPVAIPLAVSAQISLPLVIGAVLAGGSLGDNASPLGETAILSSTIADIPLMEHVKSQLPYSLSGVILSLGAFLLFGFII